MLLTTDGSDWLTLSPSSGTGDGVVSLQVTSNTLTPGTYHAAVTVSDSTQPANSASVDVTLLVQAPAIQIAPDHLSLAAMQYGRLRSTQVLNVTAPGVTWQAVATTVDGGEWLKLYTVAGTGNGILKLNVTSNSWAPGTYHAVITVSDVLWGSAMESGLRRDDILRVADLTVTHPGPTEGDCRTLNRP